MHEKLYVKSGKIRGNKTLYAIALILMLAFSAFMAITPSAKAQATTSTPSEWRELLTSTLDGAYREPAGITDYPSIASPGNNPSNTGFSAAIGPATGHVLWRDDIPIYEWQVKLADNGKIFVSSILDNCLYALDENTGEVLWIRNNSALERWSVLDYGLIFTTEGGYPVAISQNTGLTYWKGDSAGSVYGIAPVGEVFWDGEALFVDYSEYWGAPAITFCYKIQHTSWGVTISEMWNSSNVQGRLGYKDGKLYGVLEMNMWVSCVNATTGALIWNFTGTGDPADHFYPAPVIENGKVYLGTENPGTLERVDHVVCLDAETGAYKWTYVTGEYFVESISAAYGNIYIAGGERNAIHCVDGETGQKKWEYNAPGFIDYYQIQVADNKLYFNSAGIAVSGFPLPGTYPGLTNCVDAMTGELIWSYSTPTAATSPMLVDGKLIVSTEEDYIWCHAKGPTTTSVSVASSYIASDASLVISGSVADMSPFSQQHPELQSPLVAGVPVVLSYVKDGAWTDFATVNTASDGTYMSTWNPPSEGAYKVVARFEGTPSYHWSSGQAVVQVSPATSAAANSNSGIPVEYFIITVVVFAIAVVAVAVILRRRK